MKRVVMKKFMVCLYLPAVVAMGSLTACGEDPERINEEEVITTVTVTLSPQPETEGEDIVMYWDDTNLNSIVDADELSPIAVLQPGKGYLAKIDLLNKSTDPDINVSEEVENEAEDHIFCFEVSGVNITFSGFDTDSNGQRLGLRSTWTTGNVSAGTVNITLRHQPGFKTGSCPLPGDPAPGETDVDITFEVSIEDPE